MILRYSQQERRYNIVAASDVISEMNKNIDRVNEIFKVSYHKRDSHVNESVRQ